MSRHVLGVPESVVITSYVGSGEQFVVKYGDAAGNARLFDPDEGGHTLEKAMLDHASFPFVLTRGFGQDRFAMTVGKQKKHENHVFNMHLSLYAGVVEENFEELFGAASAAGFYQRVLFGHGPTNFPYHYRPVPDEINGCRFTVPQSVEIHSNVWDQLDIWRQEDPDNAGILEIALRAATICASFDHRPILRASDLTPMRHLVDYQKRVRAVLKPNLGRTVAGKITEALLNCLKRIPDGQGITQRELFTRANVYRYDAATAVRQLSCLIADGTIDTTPGPRSDSRLLYLHRVDFRSEST